MFSGWKEHDTAEQKALEKQVKSLGGKVVAEGKGLESQVTHLVIKEAIPRGFKVLCCFPKAFIVSKEYIEELHSESKWLDAYNYLHNDKDFEKKHLPKGATIASMLKEHQGIDAVLSGLQFVLKKPHKKMSDSDFEKVIQCHGGEVLGVKHPNYGPGQNTDVIVLTQTKREVDDYAKLGHGVFNFEFIFQGILTQALMFDKVGNFLTATAPTDPRLKTKAQLKAGGKKKKK